ncbi:hypothetical protein EX30DRAFT_304363 [Ascodesmis nigricans]|uniref:SAC domain-containing protein n=1 Tax=Ascodesmis nigricans TaxID=341454 RepID=A0A4S2N2T0_9PEZI|nr:hypothetical protein EX30DRAFT_304363 [Ascodesmis nigricans]
MSAAGSLFRDINVHASPSHYLFRSPSSPDHPALIIDRPSGDVRMAQKPSLAGKRVTSIAGILGMIRLRLDKYIIIITKAKLVGRIQGHSVYKVEATEFLPLQERALHDPDEDGFLALLRTHLRTGPMYFSYSFDLTNSFQRQASANHSLPLWQRTDDRFFWNRHLQGDFIDTRVAHPTIDPYILPVFFGFLKISTTILKSTPLTFVLITRKSRHRAGTRYFTRGIDENGHVANFNETEQIVIVGESAGGFDNNTAGGSREKDKVQVLSYIQTRGSVPVYWGEVSNLSYTPKLQIRGVDSAIPSTRKHFDEQIRLYGDNYLVNLVNQKGREERVKAAYEQSVRLLVSAPMESQQSSEKTSERFREIEPRKNQQRMDRLHYIYFDFHHECRGMQWHRALLLLDKLGDGLVNQGYFHSTTTTALTSIQSTQQSVVRTNCMDCLDRTNVVQSMLARWTLNRAMIDIGVLSPGEDISGYTTFELMFRNAWADNADVVSRAYSGTGALKTDFTRTGVRTKAGALADLSNSITRYIRNNFADGPRQDAYDLFLGTYVPLPPSPHRVLADRRPVIIQSVPYILAAAIFFILAALILPGRHTGWFAIFWMAVAAWTAFWIKEYGVLFVNWPKLNPPSWVTENLREALLRARGDVVVGRLLTDGVRGTRHERGMSFAGSRMLAAEEGKKRIE